MTSLSHMRESVVFDNRIFSLTPESASTELAPELFLSSQWFSELEDTLLQLL
jgi:hypothetical protein